MKRLSYFAILGTLVATLAACDNRPPAQEAAEEAREKVGEAERNVAEERLSAEKRVEEAKRDAAETRLEAHEEVTEAEGKEMTH